MSKVYHIEVTERLGCDGVVTWETAGEPVTVEGVRMVRLAHGTITHSKDFKASRAEALRVAADKIDELRLRLIVQSERLRAQAHAIIEAAIGGATV